MKKSRINIYDILSFTSSVSILYWIDQLKIHKIFECESLRVSYLCWDNSLVVVLLIAWLHLCDIFMLCFKAPVKRNIKMMALREQSLTNFQTTFLTLPVDIRRPFNVDTTSYDMAQSCIDVETTSCVYGAATRTRSCGYQRMRNFLRKRMAGSILEIFQAYKF